MTELFNVNGIKSFPDLYKHISESCEKRIKDSENSLIMSALHSDAKSVSRQWVHWHELATTQNT